MIGPIVPTLGASGTSLWAGLKVVGDRIPFPRIIQLEIFTRNGVLELKVSISTEGEAVSGVVQPQSSFQQAIRQD